MATSKSDSARKKFVGCPCSSVVVVIAIVSGEKEEGSSHMTND